MSEPKAPKPKSRSPRSVLNELGERFVERLQELLSPTPEPEPIRVRVRR